MFASDFASDSINCNGFSTIHKDLDDVCLQVLESKGTTGDHLSKICVKHMHSNKKHLCINNEKTLEVNSVVMPSKDSMTKKVKAAGSKN